MAQRYERYQKLALKSWAVRPWRSDSTKDKKTKGILLRVSPKLHIELKELAHIHGITMQNFIERCCRREIAAIEKKYQEKAK